MSTCHFCRSTIANHYFRVGPVMACRPCVATEAENEKRTKAKVLLRGVLLALPVAVASSALMWLVTELSALGGSSIFSLGAYLRGTGVAVLGMLIGFAAKEGARKRGSRALQIWAVTLTYLAYSLSFLPFVLTRMPPARITPALVMQLILIAPLTPFLALKKSLMAITGIIAIFLAMRFAWEATGHADAISVSGPFEVGDADAERTMFKGLA